MSQESARTTLAACSGIVIFCALLLAATFFAAEQETPDRIEIIDAADSGENNANTATRASREASSPSLSPRERETNGSRPDSANTRGHTDSVAQQSETQSDTPIAQEPANTSTSRDAPSLSPHVLRVIEEVQRRQQAGQTEEALNEMNALYAQYDQLSSFEQATLLNFYTNTLLALEMWSESISAFSLMLTIPDLRPDINSRATLSLGQLYAREGDYDAAIAHYSAWLANPAAETRTAEQENRVRGLLQTAREQALR